MVSASLAFRVGPKPKQWFQLYTGSNTARLLSYYILLFLVGIHVDLKKRVKYINDIVQAFDLKTSKDKLIDQMKNINTINFVNCQKYKIEEKLKKINTSKWSPEELKTHQKVSMTLQIQTKLVEELKEIMVESTKKYPDLKSIK